MIDLHKWAHKNHYKVGWGDSKYIRESLEQLKSMSHLGELNELQNAKLSQWITYDDYKIKKVNTVILVAYPTSGKTRRILFDFNGRQMTFLLPPGYGDGGALQQQEALIEEQLAGYLADYGYKVERLLGPYKNLAAKIGLGRYGRNNLIYIDGFGSYTRLIGFVTDAIMPPVMSAVNSDVEQVLESCEQCNLCKINCLTHAIGDERFLLYVDRCLAYQNERPGQEIYFVQSAKNECLVGCIACQIVCPHNKRFTGVETTISECFDEAETDYIFGRSKEKTAAVVESVNKKMTRAGLARHKEYLFRNIWLASSQARRI